MERPTFSQNWSRVSKLTPKLRPHVQIARQLFRGEPWHVVHDPVSNNFFRLNPVAYHFVGLFDGKRTVDDAWTMTIDRFGDLAPTQNEVIMLLGQLNQANLLRVDLPADAQPLLERHRQRKIKHWTGQAMSILFLRVPVFNPTVLLNWLGPLVRPILNKWGMIAWFIWMFYCAWQFLPELGRFVRDAESVLAPANWHWMVILFIVTKAIHELGHGLMCRRFGGAVPEMGIMMLIMFPAPYVDATSSWSFPDKWKRLLVAAAGMLFELTIAGGAALVWMNTEGLPRQLAYNTVFLASVTTILFNANPLLRFDGYYMLSDMLEIPNMYDRATKHFRWLVQRYVFGLENAQPVSTVLGEQVMLLMYGIASQVYRVLVLVGIIAFIAGQLLTIGLMLAAWSFIAWAVIPASKFVHWLCTNPALVEHRARAVSITLLVVIGTLAAISFIPVEEHRRTEGIVESMQRVDVAVQTDGFIQEVKVRPGDLVQKDQILLVSDNPVLRARRAEKLAELDRLRIERRKALTEDPVAMRVAESKAEAIAEELAEIEERIESLVLRSPQTGTIIGHQLKLLEGQYASRGQVIAKIADLTDVRVTSLISQSQSADAFINKIKRVEVRSVGQADVMLPATVLKVHDSGRYELPHPAMGYAGGGTIAVDQQDPQGQKTIRPHFELWFKVQRGEDEPVDAALLGQRVFVRFTLPERPLLYQWLRLLQQVIRDQLMSM